MEAETIRTRLAWILASGIAILAIAGPTANAAMQAPASSFLLPLEWTTAEDHQDMQRRLGIAALRPGPSGRENAPNPANYEESVANPYPDWPELLTLDDGTSVADHDAAHARVRTRAVAQ